MLRQRRSFSPEYKSEVVKLIREGNKSAGRVCRELDLTETAVRRWVAQAEVDAGRGADDALSTDERAELRRLRRENTQLRMEREVLKKATALQRPRSHLEISIHRDGAGRVSRAADVLRAAGVSQRILRVAHASTEYAGTGRSAAAGHPAGRL